AAESQPRGGWDTLYRFAVLWFGNPNSRFAKYFAIAGVTLISAPWWQPIVHHLVVRYLGVSDTFLADADQGMFWSGWVLIVISLCLYMLFSWRPASYGNAQS